MCRTTRLRPCSAKATQGYGGQASRSAATGARRVFFQDADRRRYLLLMLACSRVHALEIRAWCLMTNPMHFVAVPREPDGLAATLSTEQKHGQRPQWH